MWPSHDAALLIAFGGPNAPEEIRPFLNRVLQGHRAPSERVEEVVRHYEAVGGRSPLNEITFRQAGLLQELLKQRGFALPVYVGLRHAHPFLRETLDRMIADGVRLTLGFIMSPLQTEASWERYQKDVEEASAELGGCAPAVDYCPEWHAHPLLIQALAERIQPALGQIAPAKRQKVALVFTAHSVPTTMAAASPYVSQIQETSSLVAARLGHRHWLVAYQSRSGRPQDPWLEPDIGEVMRLVAAQGTSDVVVAPIGFVCDHVEVLYDLDIEARRTAENLGMRFVRAPSLNDHPIFIRMMAEVIEAKLSAISDQPKGIKT